MKNNPDKELFSKPTSTETERIVKSTTKDLSVAQFATIPGIKGNQFNREIFTSLLKFKDLSKFLEVFPEVQRSASNRKITQIKNYILSGVEKNLSMRFFSGLTVTARGHIFYDESTNTIAIDTNKSKLSINDGQHRFYGINAAITELRGRVNRAKSASAMEKAEALLKELNNMVVPLVLFNNISEEEEKQLFHDLNNLASRPSRSATIRLAQTDLLATLAREVAQENTYFVRYGVEFDKMSIHPKNPNTVLLTTIYESIKNLYYRGLSNDINFINKNNFNDLKAEVHEFFNSVFNVLPDDIHVKGKYIFSRGYALKGIAKFYHEQVNNKVPESKILQAIQNVDWRENIDYWSKYKASTSKSGSLLFPGHNVGGMYAVRNACCDELAKIK